jgi:hypothetical protein
MDFFHGLDVGRYGVFKTSMINGWMMGAFEPPKMVNAIHQVEGNWVKPTSRIEGGTSANYVTIEEHATMQVLKEKSEKNKEKQSSKKLEGNKGEAAKKTPKDGTQLECWYCKEKGHF